MEEFKESQLIAYKIITNSIKKNHLVHAYIIETNGYFKGLDFAISFAKTILSLNSNIDKEKLYQMIDSNNYPEFKIINPDGFWIKKEQLLELKEEFNKKTIIGNKKIYIINKADKLNVNSANTLLKFLEEPEEGIVAILVVDNVCHLLNTIVSRCQIITLNNTKNYENNEKTINKIGFLLTNNEKDYYQFIEEEKNNEKLENILKFAKYYEKNKKKSLIFIKKYWFNYFNDKDSINTSLLILTYFYKDVLNFKINSNIEIFNNDLEMLKEVSELNTIETLINKITVLNENRKNLENNANLNLLMDKIIIELEEGVI